MAGSDPYRIIHTLQNIEHVGTSPALWSGLFSGVSENEVDIKELSEALSREPTVCAQLLKVANSPHYYRGKRIGTVSEAVLHLGLQMVKRIVLAVELIGLYRNRSDTSGFDIGDFWRHTLAGAMIARELAQNNRFAEPEAAYVSALLRDLGVLVIRQYFPDLFVEILTLINSRRISFKKASSVICGMSHRDVSVHVATRWDLPPKIVMPLNDRYSGDEPEQDIRRFTEVADTMLYQQGYGTWDPFFSEIASETDIIVSGLSPDAMDSLSGKIIPQVDEIASQIVF